MNGDYCAYIYLSRNTITQYPQNVALYFTDVSTKIKNGLYVVTNVLLRLCGYSVFEPAICKAYHVDREKLQG